ncbi:D-erythrulose-1-phosphate dehydrogenase [Aurantimonas manganoxydans SI85-9A1]|uniref:D-erythrulose-1-phosphate dehydrogenase n=2 Tax=Aurantimonas manganoxydans (strain ATCC BAA-1229 / DSM 21871 / SI85-9A1) TaxID=287752 RepID=Q1YJP5_AURMS|nr:TIM barrel protein [Aurantimonas manganoxydans]EAS50828.1 D-erythrulose-1-phosphate dehydrogenase [Aurantimonas manganoxydans SI85-9A1]
MAFTLSISTNPLVNRYAEPEDLMTVVADEIGIGHLQLTHEFLNPSWPAGTLRPLVARMATAAAANGVSVTSLMTGPYGRLNHFGHPDPGVRAYTIAWFKTLADIAADLGCPAIGTQFAIMTYRDFDDPDRREALMRAALDGWADVAAHAAGRGLTWMFWEPMSVGREFGHTLDACAALQSRIAAAGLPIPLRPMIDIDHGDVTSPDPADTDPYAWAERFAAASPIVHVKQSSMDKGGHWPFTAAHNANGRITPERLLASLRAGGGQDNELCLELAFREREPTDRQVVAALAESVAHWAPYADTGLAGAAKDRVPSRA